MVEQGRYFREDQGVARAMLDPRQAAGSKVAGSKVKWLRSSVSMSRGTLSKVCGGTLSKGPAWRNAAQGGGMRVSLPSMRAQLGDANGDGSQQGQIVASPTRAMRASAVAPFSPRSRPRLPADSMVDAYDAGEHRHTPNRARRTSSRDSGGVSAGTAVVPGARAGYKPGVSKEWLVMAACSCEPQAGAETAPSDCGGHKGGRPGWRLRAACVDGIADYVRDLLQAGGDPDVRCADGCSAIHLASYAGHRDCIRHLLNAGSHVDASSDLGDTALMLAAANGYGDCVDLLLAARADPCRQNKQGNTALHRAALWAQREVCTLLLKGGKCGSVQSHRTPAASRHHVV